MSRSKGSALKKAEDKHRHHKRTSSVLNDYHLGDSRKIADFLKGQRIDCTITSPPYWNLKDYGSDGQIGFGQSYDRYLADLVGVFTAIWERTTRDGSLWLIVDSIKRSGRVHLLPFDLISRLTEHPARPWHLQDIVIWHKPHTLPWSHQSKLQGNFEYIVCLSKSKQMRLNIEAIRSTLGIANWWVKYPERYHPQGKSISNVWEYSIPTQGTWGQGLLSHVCPIPTEMASRIVLLSTTSKRQVVLDPFAGSGPVLLAAKNLGRQWIGVDLNRSSRKMFYRRLAHETGQSTGPVLKASSFTSANLKLRQLKYAVQLFKKIAPSQRVTAKEIPVMVVQAGVELPKASPHWVTNCRLFVAVDDTVDRKKLKAAIAHQQAVPPLSKFQLEVEVVLISKAALAKKLREFGKKSLYRYTRGQFWKPLNENDNVGIRKRVIRIPDLLSDIHVDERPAF